MNPDSTSTPVAESWDAYWHGTGDAGAYSSGGASHPAILSFWTEFFQGVERDYPEVNPPPKIIDIASGNGAVIELALAIFADGTPTTITCLDVSTAAVTNIRNRFPHISGLVADARSIPLDSGGFDIVTSQFGVEYAGEKAIDEAVRLVAPGGRLALLLHNQASSIHRECAASLDAITRLQESGFIPTAIDMFTAGFAACRGADRAPYDAAATRLAPAVQALDSIMVEHGQGVAGDTIARLYGDVDQIHQKMQSYEPADVLSWLNRIDSELEAYAGRMSSMCESAFNDKTFDRIRAGLDKQEFTLERAEPLTGDEDELPLAWVLIAKRNNFPDDVTASVGEYQSKNISGSSENEQRTEVRPWIKRLLGRAVYDLMDRGIIDSTFVESKPAWAAPFQVLIGKIRNYGDSENFIWVICGEVPTDHLDSTAAATPREAARHFVMKWQLGAARHQEPSAGNSPENSSRLVAKPHLNEELVDKELAGKAESLYALVEDAGLWERQSNL